MAELSPFELGSVPGAGREADASWVALRSQMS